MENMAHSFWLHQGHFHTGFQTKFDVCVKDAQQLYINIQQKCLNEGTVLKQIH